MATTLQSGAIRGALTLPTIPLATYFVMRAMQASRFLICKLFNYDRLCGLVVRVPVYKFRGLVSIPFSTRFSE
jgi:hypothetical protein